MRSEASKKLEFQNGHKCGIIYDYAVKAHPVADDFLLV